MVDILKWLIDGFSSKTPNSKILLDSRELPIELDTETDRVMFVKAAAQLLATKLNIKLNTKRLYQSDVLCISELSKLSTILYKSMLESTNALNNPNETITGPNQNTTLEDELGDTTDDKTVVSVQRLKDLSKNITTSGSNLYQLLTAEIGKTPQNALAMDRFFHLSKPIKIEEIEKELRNTINQLNRQSDQLEEKIRNIDSEEEKMNAKIASKKEELKRSEKRLETLKSVRPAFQDELDELEEQVKMAYDVYLTEFRV